MIDYLEHIRDRIQKRAKKGERRSPKWRKVRKDFVKKNPFCAVCQNHKKVEVHHITPFNVDPSLELEESNLITLCGRRAKFDCHRLFGHFMDYRRYNKNVVDDSETWRRKIC